MKLRKTTKELDSKTRKILTGLAEMYDLLREEEGKLAKRKSETRNKIVEILKKNGNKRPDGGFVIDLEDFRVEVSHKKSYSIDEEVADEFFEDHPKLRDDATVVSYNLDAIDQMHDAEEIPDKVFSKMVVTSTSEVIGVTRL